MANFKRYPIIGASKYEVTHDGKVINRKKDKEMGIRKDGRAKITNDEGNQVYVTPTVEYGRAKIAEGCATTKLKLEEDPYGNIVEKMVPVTPKYYSMGPEFPSYVIDKNADIYHETKPYNPLQDTYANRVILTSSNGISRDVNRFKMFAIYALGHKDPSTEYVQFLKRQVKDDEVTLKDIKYRTKGFYENVNPVVPVVPLEKPSSSEWVTWHNPRSVIYGSWVIEDGFEDDGEPYTTAFIDPETGEPVVLSID